MEVLFLFSVNLDDVGVAVRLRSSAEMSPLNHT